MAFNFDHLWLFYTKACAAGGILTFSQAKDRTVSLRIYQKFCQLFFLLFVFSQIFTLATQYTDLTVVVIAGAGIVIFGAVSSGPIQLTKCRENFMIVIQWCRALHANGQHFDPMVREFAKNHFEVAGQKSMKILKIFTYLLVFDGFACTILFTTLANFLPIELLEKFHPPFPFDVPFHNQATWKSFLINLLIQTFGIVNGTLLGNAVMSIYCVIFIHLLAYLHAILAAVKTFDDFLRQKYREESLEKIKGRKIVEIFRKIVSDCECGSRLDDSSTFIKVIVDMCSEFNDQMGRFSNLSSPIFLIWEFTSLFTTFISGIILLLERQHFILSLGVLMANIFYLSFCLVNDVIMEKISKINIAMYNLPWYSMPSSERRMILMAKHTFNVQVGFTSGGFHNLNLEQFKNVTETAISYCLVLKTLAEQ